MDEPAAYRWLQRASMDGRMTMRAVAELVIEESERPAAPGRA